MDYYLGMILAFPYNFVPYQWQRCDGTVLNVQQNTALFSLIGNKFGGNGQTTFAVPNLTNCIQVPNMIYCICVSGLYPTRQ